MITKGFGMTLDMQSGSMRNWFIGRDGVKRWADTQEPVDSKHDTEANDKRNSQCEFR